MKKFLFLTAVLLTFSFGLTACDAGDNVAIAVEYIEALERGDLDTAAALVCDEREEEIANSLIEVTEEERDNFAFTNVSCTARGGDVECRYNIVQDTTVDNTQEFQRNVIFEFEGDQICEFEQGVASPP